MTLATTAHGKTTIDDNWRSWIAENLMLGCPPDTVAASLLQAGVGLDDVHSEIAAAQASPYLRGAQRLRNRLAKRDWVLDIPAKLSRLAPPTLARRHRLSAAEFFAQFYCTNLPVIITGMLDDCPARKKWSVAYFRREFADRLVQVQFGREADQHYELNSIAHKRTMPFGEFVDLVGNSGSTNDFYMTANNDTHNRAALADLWNDMPRLAEYLAPAGEGKEFFWFGPAGTVTPFHHDLTNNFMAQIMGRKRVRLIAPYEVSRVGNVRHCFSEIDGRDIDLQRHPAMAGVPVLECELAPGELLFLPVGWWHFVEGLDISVTVSMTNFRLDNDFYSNYPSDHAF